MKRQVLKIFLLHLSQVQMYKLCTIRHTQELIQAKKMCAKGLPRIYVHMQVQMYKSCTREIGHSQEEDGQAIMETWMVMVSVC